MDTCEIRTFGGLEVTIGGAPVETFGARSAAAVFVYLAHADGPVSRDALADMLWPDRPRDAAQANLRSAVHRIRRVVPEHLEVTRTSLAARYVRSDALTLEELLRAGDLREAVASYRGDFLAGFAVDGGAGFEAWQSIEAERYRELVLGALEELVSAALAGGALDEALEHGRHLLRIDPLHEPIHRALARALARAGRRGAALAQLDACTATIVAELGIEPDPATLRLAASIRDGTTDDASVDLPAREIAADADRPSPVSAAPAAAVDRVRGSGSGSTGPVDLDLPQFAGPLVGRAAQLELVARRLSTSDCRWLTILGPGGVGKTRLAVAAAHTLAHDFADGVRFVGLAGVRDVGYVMHAVAAALRLDPLPPGDPIGHVEAYLRDKQVLLVIDNLERLTDAAPQLAGLLRRSPATRVLATSRTRLHLSEEWLLPLDGLSDVADAQALFTAHAARAGADVDTEGSAGVVREICALVENLPLALELAATWSNALSLERIAASLRSHPTLLQAPRPDAPERHRSLAAAFDASWELLPQHLAEVLAGLGVFRGGFAATEAARVAHASEDDLLALVDRSLVRARGDGRFDLHELIRQYALAQLASRSEVEATARRHLHAYLDLARPAASQLYGRELEVGLARLRAEADNVRAALSWGLERDADADAAIELLEAMAPYWRLTCGIEEARAWLARAERWLTRFPHHAAAVRAALGHFAWMAGDFEEADELLRRSLAGWEPTDPVGRSGRTTTLISLGMTAWSRRRYEHARAAFDEALDELEEVDQPWWRAIALGWCGKTAAATGDLDDAQRDLDASLELFARIGNPWGMGLFIGTAAELHVARGDLDEARRLAESAAELLERVGFRHALGPVYELLAVVAARAGVRREAARRAAQAIATYRDLGDVAAAEAVAERLASPPRSAAAARRAGATTR
jgi:predicted ATPase/DNA-binding SARP family transcriptional activator